MTTTILYLIRHGATPANEKRPYILQGSGINHSLSERGQQQAENLGEFLKTRTIDQLYCTPLIRTRETAEQIGQHHGLTPTVLDELIEVDVGDWEGMPWSEIMKRYPHEYASFMSAPGETPYLNGESYVDVLGRVRPVLTRLIAEHVGQSIAVVAHNVVNRAFLAEPLGLSLNQAREIRQTNTGINVLKATDGKLELVTLNGCFHLGRPE